MIRSVCSTLGRLLGWGGRRWPFFVGLALLWIVYRQLGAPGYPDYLPLSDGKLTEAQKQAISMTTELNKYFISLATLIFGGLGFGLTQYRVTVDRTTLVLTLPIVLTLLGSTYFYAFWTYAQMTMDLAQDSLSLYPGHSRALYYVEMEFWACLGASVTMVCLFVDVVLRNVGSATSDAAK